VVIADNFDVGGGFHPQNNSVGAAVSFQSSVISIRATVKFQVPGSSSTFFTVTLPVSFAGANDKLRVRITEDAAGAPGTRLEVLSNNELIWPAFANPFLSTPTLTSASNPTLAGDSPIPDREAQAVGKRVEKKHSEGYSRIVFPQEYSDD
jgi:hypothetical protein